VLFKITHKIRKFRIDCELSPRGEIFSGKRDFLKDRPKFPNGISEWEMCVPFASFHWFQVVSLGSPLIFQGKVVEMERAHRTHIPVEISI